MLKSDESEVFALIENIDHLTDEVGMIMEKGERLTSEEVDEIGELYQRRGELLTKLNEQFSKAGARSEWQKSEQFRSAITRLQDKNNRTTEKLGLLTNDASQRLRESVKQRALIAYSHQL